MLVLPNAAEPRPGSFTEKESPVQWQCFVPQQLTQKQATDTLPHQPHRHRPTHTFLGEDLQMILQVKITAPSITAIRQCARAHAGSQQES